MKNRVLLLNHLYIPVEAHLRLAIVHTNSVLQGIHRRLITDAHVTHKQKLLFMKEIFDEKVIMWNSVQKCPTMLQ